MRRVEKYPCWGWDRSFGLPQLHEPIDYRVRTKLELYFKAKTPLGVVVRTTKVYWSYLIEKKHPQMEGKEKVVIETLSKPKEIRRSIIDNNVYLYYKQFDRLYCVVAKHQGSEGFLVTAYPTDKVKEGEIIWTE